MNKYNRIQLIIALVDCFGYSESDFDSMLKKDILQYITDNQKNDVIEYLK